MWTTTWLVRNLYPNISFFFSLPSWWRERDIIYNYVALLDISLNHRGYFLKKTAKDFLIIRRKKKKRESSIIHRVKIKKGGKWWIISHKKKIFCKNSSNQTSKAISRAMANSQFEIPLLCNLSRKVFFLYFSFKKCLKQVWKRNTTVII